MNKHKYHINQPDLNHPPRPGFTIAREPLVISAEIPDTDLHNLGSRFEVSHPTGMAVLSPGISTTIRPGLSMGRVGTPLFRTALYNNRRTMIINDARGFEDYKQFQPRFAARFPNALPVPGLEVIGCGYNIFGPYAEASALKRRLFDVDKMSPLAKTYIGGVEYSHWPIVTIHPQSVSKRFTIIGENAISFTRQLSLAAGLAAGYLGFHAQTEIDFFQSETRNIYYAFTHVFDVTQTFSIHLDDRSDLRNYLTDEALNAIDNADGQWPPERLFQEFGLYFLTGAVMGGRLNHWSHVDMFYLAANTDLRVLAEADFLGIIGGTSSVQSSTSFTTYQQHSESQTTTIGGDPTKGGGSIIDQTSYQYWKNSIASMPGFIDFTLPSTKTPLTPIWKLATGTRAAELEEKAQVYEDNVSRQFEQYHSIEPEREAVTYIVTTLTGSDNGAGTDSGIWIQLHGVNRLGEAQETPKLKHDDSQDNHNKNMIDAIEFSGLLDVGELTKVTVIHDGSKPTNRGPAWQLKQIEVLCLQNGKKYTAYYNGWLNGNSGTFDLYAV